MKIAITVQRYGVDIVGGAEYLTRKIAEHLSKFHEVEVLTTCAGDYISWKNELKEGVEEINGVRVRRFRNSSSRDMNKFMAIQEKVFYGTVHTAEDEIQWVREQGPYSPDLVRYIQGHKKEYDIFIFSTFRYFPTFYALPFVSEKSIIIPFAEDDPALKLKISKKLFELTRGIIFSSPEERNLIQKQIGSLNKISDTIGCGIDLRPPNNSVIKSSLKKLSVEGNFVLYLGRVDGSKGCYTLFDYFSKYVDETKIKDKLILAGTKQIPVPRNPSIRFIGRVSELEKGALLKSANLVVMPSYLESFSLVTLEAMLSGIPVLVNGSCEVLKGHCIRSNGGLWYETYDEFKECLNLLLSNKTLRKKLGKNGRIYVKKNYSWDIVEKKFLKILEKISKCNKK